MSTMVPMYGFGGGNGGAWASLTVNAPAGATVTVSKDGKSKTKVAGADGVAVFKGLSTGEWTVTITNGTDTSTDTVQLTADYSTSITFFSATIHVTYPAGSTCTATDGVTTLTAPDTSGTWDCVVPNAGTWTVSIGVADETVMITSSGQSVSVTVNKKYIFKCGEGTLVDISTASQKNALVTVTNDNIICEYSGSGYHQVNIVTNVTFDLSAYRLLCLDAKITGIGEDKYKGRIGVGSDKFLVDENSTYEDQYRKLSAAKFLTADNEQKTYTLDISTISDYGYVGIIGGLAGTITNIWLECAND